MHHLKGLRKDILILLAVPKHRLHRLHKSLFLLLPYILLLQQHFCECSALGLSQSCRILMVKLLKQLYKNLELLFLECKLVRLEEVLCLVGGDWELCLLDDFLDILWLFVAEKVSEYSFELGLVQFFTYFLSSEGGSYLTSELLALVIVLLVKMIFEDLPKNLDFNIFLTEPFNSSDNAQAPI